MPDMMIEPNIHPVLVHFTYALLTMSALSLLVVEISSKARWRDSLQHAGDWMLAFGAIFIIATIAAGFEAYYMVAHDGPSHAAMTTHRNWAVPSAVAILILAGWRYVKRAKRPGILFALAMLVAAGLLTTTAWWGGQLVYVHGLGVQSMPKAEGPGHDHEHGPGEEHGPGADGDADAADHEGTGDPASEASADPMAGMDHASMEGMTADAAAPVASGPYPATPAAVVDAFAVALKSGDAAMVERLLLPDVLIAEGGGAERSFAEYAGHHLPADMAFTKAVEFTLKDRKSIEGADMATIISTSQVHGEFQGKAIHSASMETMVLKRIDDQWRIAHIHWSSAPITGEHEH